jgi:hypothetical protein
MHGYHHNGFKSGVQAQINCCSTWTSENPIVFNVSLINNGRDFGESGRKFITCSEMNSAFSTVKQSRIA